MNASQSITEALKVAIANSGKTRYQIAKEAKIRQVVVDRFFHGKRDLRLATVDKICRVLGLRLTAGDS